MHLGLLSLLMLYAKACSKDSKDCKHTASVSSGAANAGCKDGKDCKQTWGATSSTELHRDSVT